MNGYGPVRQIALPAGTSADEAQGPPLDLRGYRGGLVTITGTGTTSSGVVTLEEASYNPWKEPIYGGTWSAITTVNATDVTGGAQKVVHLTANQLPEFLRVRVSTAIGGGGSIEAVVSAW